MVIICHVVSINDVKKTQINYFSPHGIASVIKCLLPLQRCNIRGSIHKYRVPPLDPKWQQRRQPRLSFRINLHVFSILMISLSLRNVHIPFNILGEIRKTIMYRASAEFNLFQHNGCIAFVNWMKIVRFF